MPGPSNAAAHEYLELMTQAGGADWEIVLLSVMCDSHSTGGTVITDFDPVPVPRDSSTWSTPASRKTHMLVDVEFGDATVDSVAVGWKIRDASGNGIASAQLTGGSIAVPTGEPADLAGTEVVIQVL